jgi:PhnB protein
MSTINSYLNFNGNCRQAMKFYQKCLGGTLHFQTVGDSPMKTKLPAKIRKTILYAQLIGKDFLLMASDMIGEDGLIRGNNISIVLNCKTERQIRSNYKKLSAGGKQTHPLALNYWGILSGTLIDKYGTYWLLISKKNKHTMQKVKINKDIRVFYIQAKSFPDGVMEAFQQMHSIIEIPPQRRSFGISRPEKGKIIYRVACEEVAKGDLEKHHLTEFIISKGVYLGVEIKNFRKDLTSIKKAFNILIANPKIDPDGYYIEEYKGIDDVFCMVRLKDEK